MAKCMIIAEVAQAHDGSLGLAHSYIDSIAVAGADGVKFQTHIAEAESTMEEPWRVKFSRQDSSRYSYWKRMEFTPEQWVGLRDHAKEKGLLFLSSPFSLQAFELLERVGVDAWKVASGEISNLIMLDKMIDTGFPLLISTGMSPLEEIDLVVERVMSRTAKITVLQCTSMYPTPPEKVGLEMLPFFRERYGCNVGLSDHSGTIYAGLAAATLGAQVIEVHVTFSREMFGPDVVASITFGELRQLVEGVRFIESMNTNDFDKDAMASDLAEMRRIFGKSIVIVSDLKSGEILKPEHLTAKKPGTGLPLSYMQAVIGKRLIHDLPANTLLQKSDFED